MPEAQRAQKKKTAAARQSAHSTMPGDSSHASHAWLSDRPSWCVDNGSTLTAMTTCDLWLAVAKGDITPDTLIWREGMPYWEPVSRVPELELALPNTRVWKTPSVRPPPPASQPVESAPAPVPPRSEPDTIAASPAASHTDSDIVGVATFAPAGDYVTPAPVVVVNDDPEATPAVPPTWLGRLDRRSLVSMAIGAWVAITALVLATTSPTPQASSDPSALPMTRPAAANHADSFDVASLRPAAAPRPSVDSPAADETAPPGEQAAPPDSTSAPQKTLDTVRHDRIPRGPRSADRGQRRSRTGTNAGKPAAQKGLTKSAARR